MLKAADRIVGKFLKWGSVILLTIVFLLLIANVFFQFFPIISFGWFDEVIEMLIAWMVFLRTAALWRENDHFTITFLPELFQGKKSASHLTSSPISPAWHSLASSPIIHST